MKILGRFNFEVQPLSAELNRSAGEAKSEHFLEHVYTS